MKAMRIAFERGKFCFQQVGAYEEVPHPIDDDEGVGKIVETSEVVDNWCSNCTCKPQHEQVGE
jgi:hypothetical protein